MPGKNGLLPEYEIVGVLGRNEKRATFMAAKAGCPVCKNIQELLEQNPDYVAEMASVQLVREIAKPVLCHGANLVVLSVGAFAEEAFYEEISQVAREQGTHVHIASGAIGGFDVLRTISLMGELAGESKRRRGLCWKYPRSHKASSHEGQRIHSRFSGHCRDKKDKLFHCQCSRHDRRRS